MTAQEVMVFQKGPGSVENIQYRGMGCCLNTFEIDRLSPEIIAPFFQRRTTDSFISVIAHLFRLTDNTSRKRNIIPAKKTSPKWSGL